MCPDRDRSGIAFADTKSGARLFWPGLGRPPLLDLIEKKAKKSDPLSGWQMVRGRAEAEDSG